jgi:hypothetical protein
MKFNRSATAIALLLVLLLVACSMSTIITDIQIAVDAVSVAAPVIAAFAGPGATAILAYTTAATNGLNCVLTAAEMPNVTTAMLAAAISTCLATIVAPQFPPGTPQVIINLVSAVVTDVANIITRYGAKGTLAAGVNGGTKLHLTYGDHRAISSMQHKLNMSLATLNTHK